MTAKEKAGELLSLAGISINGSNPWDIQVHDERFYSRVLAGGTLALGETYIEKWWDCEELDTFFAKLLEADIESRVGRDFESFLMIAKSKILNMQTKKGSREVIDEHYDLDNDLYKSFLDPYNQYTCGYFKDTTELNQAQENKLDLICRKLELKRGDTLLDIGCGWGGLAKFAAEHYGAHVTGISISDEQIEYAREFCKGFSVEIKKVDYRDVEGEFDKVVSVGMIEHVGYKNYREFMEVVHRVLKDDGIFLLHHIGGNISVTRGDPWIDKYIFPNGMLPSIKQIGESIEHLFVMEDWHNFGAYYDKTLIAWMKNFDATWPELKEKYDERFYRIWKYYFLTMAGLFRSRRGAQLWQIVMTKHGIPNGYQSVR